MIRIPSQERSTAEERRLRTRMILMKLMMRTDVRPVLRRRRRRRRRRKVYSELTQ